MPRNWQYTCPQPSLNGVGTSPSWSSLHHGNRAAGWWPEWLRNADHGYVGKTAHSGDGRRPKQTSGFRWTWVKQPCPVVPLVLTCPMKGSHTSFWGGPETAPEYQPSLWTTGGFDEKMDKSNDCRRNRAQTLHKPNPTEVQTPAGPWSPSPQQKELPHICNGWSGAGHVPASPWRGTNRHTAPNPGTYRPATASTVTDSFAKTVDVKPAADGQGVAAAMKQDTARESRPPMRGPPSRRTPGSSSAASGTGSKRTSTAQICKETAIPCCQKSVMGKTKWTCPTKSS